MSVRNHFERCSWILFLWFVLVAVLLFAILPLSSLAQVHVLTYHNNNRRTGENTNETVLTPENLNATSFGKLFVYNVDGYVYAQPLYVSGLSIPGQGTHNVVFVATEHNSVYAFDADSKSGPSGGLLWQVNLGPSAATPNSDFGNRYGGFNEILPEVGITGTPVIDLASGTLYVDAFTHEGPAYFHKIHALNITNGNERAFSPVLVSASFPGVGVGGSNGAVFFQPKQQLQRSAITLARGILYVAYGGYADTDPYHGWILGYDASNLQPLTNYVFNSTPNSTVAAFGANAGEGGIWMGGGGLAVDAGNSLYFTVGNGSFNAFNNSGGTEYGDSIIRLSSSNRLSVADYFTPYNQAFLGANDLDVGSGGVMLLPDQVGSTPHLMFGGGKQGRMYLLNRDMLTTGNNHYNAGGSSDAVLQKVDLAGGVFTTPAYFNGRIYLAATADALAAFSISNGILSASAVSSGPRAFPFPGATPSISANGTGNGIVWALRMGSPGLLTAYRATDLSTELYNSSQAAFNRDVLTDGVKFSVPTIANGKVFVGGRYALSVFGLLRGAIQFSAPAFTVQENGGTAKINVLRSGGVSGAVQVNYSILPGGTAVSGVNYIDTSGTLSWADGDGAAKSFTLTILDDHRAAGNKTINLGLSAPSGSANLGLPTNALLTILEAPYDNWKFSHFGSNANNPAIAGNLADPDLDRVINLLEYAHAGNPNLPDPSNRPVGFVLSNRFQLRFSQNLSATDLTYAAQASGVPASPWTNLATFTAATGWVTNTPGYTLSISPPVGSPPDQRVTITVSEPAILKPAGPQQRFFRVTVQQ
jgi:hypothetical protein